MAARAARLAKLIRGHDCDATRQARIRLGKIINNAIMTKRNADKRALGEAMPWPAGRDY